MEAVSSYSPQATPGSASPTSSHPVPSVSGSTPSSARNSRYVSVHVLDLNTSISPPANTHGAVTTSIKIGKPTTPARIQGTGSSRNRLPSPPTTSAGKPPSTPPTAISKSTTGNNTITLEDILIGEVWVCSGQSNMQWPVSKCAVGRVLIRDVLARVKAGKEKMPVIREGKVTNVFSSLHPIEHAKGAWSNGSNFGDYSAISCAFAYDLYRELKIPIGILNCAFSTTTIQAWTPRVGIESGTDDYTKALHNRVLEGDFRTPENKAAWEQYYRDLRDWAKGNAERYK